MRLAASFVLLGIVAAFPQNQAAAFDCGKAATAVEKAICADPALKALDDELGEAYAEVRAASTPGEQKMLAKSQKRWIASREYCTEAEAGVAACIERATQERINLLNGEAESGPGPDGTIVPIFVVQDGTEKVYDLDVAVLRFAEPDTAGQTRFNAIAAEITERLKLGEHGQETFGSIYAQQDTMVLTYASPDFISVVHSFYSNEGGAHGNGGLENFNIDMRTGKLLEIQDVLSEDAAGVLMKQCKEQIVAEKKIRMEGIEDYDVAHDTFITDEVISEHVATLSRWSIDGDDTVITFDAYAIGSYAEGSYECRFKTGDVKAIALDGAPLP